MKKITIVPTLDIPTDKPSIRAKTDEIQRMVEYYFAQGFEASDIADKLSIDIKDAEKRYNQVYRQYGASADKYSSHDARINILKLITRSRIRRDMVEKEINRVGILITEGSDVEFPNKEIANLRAEDQFLYKIMFDFSRGGKNSLNSSTGKKEQAQKEGADTDAARREFGRVLSSADRGIAVEAVLIDDDLEADLKLAMAEEDL